MCIRDSYGVDEETVPEVVGRLLAEKGLFLGVLDLVTRGRFAKDLEEAGCAAVISAAESPQSLEAAMGRFQQPRELQASGLDLAALFAERIAPEGGVGLALVNDPSEDRALIAVHGPGDIRIAVPSRSARRETSYMRRWIITLGLDWVRRAVLGQLTSPTDWRTEKPQ